MTRRNIAKVTANQPRLFDDRAETPELRCAGSLRDALNQAIKSCKRGDRYWIAAEMSRALQTDITASMINSWTAASKEDAHHIPLEYMAAFCHITGSVEPIRVIVELLGHELVSPAEHDLVKAARLDLQISRLRAERDRLQPTVLAYQSDRRY